MGKAMSELHPEIKQLIIDSLNLEGLTPEDIDSEAPLFGRCLVVRQPRVVLLSWPYRLSRRE